MGMTRRAANHLPLVDQTGFRLRGNDVNAGGRADHGLGLQDSRRSGNDVHGLSHGVRHLKYTASRMPPYEAVFQWCLQGAKGMGERKHHPNVSRSLNFFVDLFVETKRISFHLFKIMIPVVIGVKILQELGAVELLGSFLSPLMGMVGLPGSMGLVWATTLLTNLYGGIAVFVNLIGDTPLTVAQTTVLGSMMLVAHGLPVELRIAQAAGIRLLVMGALRMGGALLYGWILHWTYLSLHWLQRENTLNWVAPVRDESLAAWGIAQIRSLFVIFLVIFGLLLLLKILARIRFTEMLNRALHPLLRLLGIGHAATPITLIGMTLGLAYGGGLIIQEARSGRLEKRDVFFSLALMGLCHSLIEDTLLVAFLGSHLSGILWGRMAFALVVVFLMVRLYSRFAPGIMERWIFRG